LTTTSSPTVRRRRLAAVLRELREARGLTVADAAKSIDCDPSRLSRVERAIYPPPRGPELRILLALYGVTGEDAEKLVVIGREARQKGWWHSYKDSVTDGYLTFIGLEDAAETIRAFEAALIPGLLQTGDYARAIVAGGPLHLDPGQAEARVQVRMDRQKLLTREAPLHLHAVIDEAILSRPVGGTAVMREQLAHLAGCAQMTDVTMQVLPASCGMYPSMAGAFQVIRFPDPEDPDVGYADTPLGTLYTDDPDDVDRLNRAFQNLSAAALPPHASMEAVARAAASM
jgi:transcriptional regulator with XRE-family HTH domain